MSLKITIRQVGRVGILDCKGRLTYGESVNTLARAVQELMGLGKKLIILNLENVSYTDPTAVGAMIHWQTTINSKGGELILLNPNARLKTYFNTTKLETAFQVFDDEGEALESFEADRFCCGPCVPDDSVI